MNIKILTVAVLVCVLTTILVVSKIPSFAEKFMTTSTQADIKNDKAIVAFLSKLSEQERGLLMDYLRARGCY